MISFNIDFDDGDLREIIKRAKKLRTFRGGNPYFDDMRDEVARYMRSQWVRNFNLQGNLYGPWPPLSAYTKARKTTNKKLVESGEMYREFLEVTNEPDFSGNGISWNFEYVKGGILLVHQFGTNRAGAFNNITIPARRVYGIRPQDRVKIAEIVRKHLKKFVSVTMSGK